MWELAGEAGEALERLKALQPVPAPTKEEN